MKTINLYKSAICLLAGIGTFTSCSTDDHSYTNDRPQKVQLISQNNHTRAAETYWNAADSIGVFITTHGSSEIIDGVSNKKYITPTGDGIFKAATEDAYYPANGSKIDIRAYYPFSSELSGTVYPVDLTDQSKQELIDFMYSANLKGISKTDELQNMVFDHMLTKIVFTLKAGEGLTEADLEGISVMMHGASARAYFDLYEGVLSPSQISESIIAFTSPDGGRSELIIVPGEVTDAEIEITLSTGLVLNCALPHVVSYKASTKYSYSLTISPDIVVWDGTGTINPWENEDGSELDATEPKQTRYAVGDYFPEATNPSTAMGVVFSLDDAQENTSTHGLIVSLREGWGSWGKTYGTYPDMYTEESMGVEGISSSSDGRQGTVNLIRMRMESEDFADKYKAFAYILALNDNDPNGIWYMPARDELKILKEWYEADPAEVNSIITAAGGSEIGKRSYWTSTETAYDKAHYMQFETTNSMSAMKNITSLRVRAIAKF